MTGTNFSDWFNASEGTLLAEAVQSELITGSKVAASLNDGSTTNRFTLYRQSGGALNGYSNPGAIVSSLGVISTVGTPWTQALAYSGGTTSYSVNASATVARTYTTSGIDRLGIGIAFTGATDFLCGHIMRIAYWPQRLTNAELRSFTK
jgi:hypothetical protein